MTLPVRVIFRLLAAVWLGLGIIGNDPGPLDHTGWLMFAAVIAGMSLAVAQWPTGANVHRWAILVTGYAAVRSISYVEDGSFGPLFVWSVVVLLALVIVEVTEREPA